MEQLYVLGTGNAAVTRCYNTCFAIRKGEEYLLTDAGGGNGILRVLEDRKIPLEKIHHMILTHEHTDHLLGAVWIVRMIAAKINQGKYEPPFRIYCHTQLCETLTTLCRLTLFHKFYDRIGETIELVPVEDGDVRPMLGYDVCFFDIHSDKAKQLGFTLTLENGEKLTCCGDEPYNPLCRPYVEGSGWLLHEAFCLYEDREIFRPYEKFHSTVKDACELAEALQVPHLVLWHTEDRDLAHRKERYTAEGRLYYGGDLHVPDDGEILRLS
jgi:ribonuclease Z